MFNKWNIKGTTGNHLTIFDCKLIDAIASKKLISKLFVRHLSRDKHWNEGKKNLIDCLIKLNKDV